MMSDHLPLVIEIFQSTHPRGVRRSMADLTEQTAVYFNPRTHVGCDTDSLCEFGYVNISIHAPTWGATLVGLRGGLLGLISIHAPTWGATELL